MHSHEASEFQESLFRLFQGHAAPTSGGQQLVQQQHLQQQQLDWLAPVADPRLGPVNGMRLDPAASLSNPLLSKPGDGPSASDNGVGNMKWTPGCSQSSETPWGGSLWSGSNNIWSIGQDAQAQRTRHSIDIPQRVDTGILGRPPPAEDNRRSLDSLNALQAIWQQQQQQQNDQQQLQQHLSQQHQRRHNLSQQLSSLSIQEGTPFLSRGQGQQQLASNGMALLTNQPRQQHINGLAYQPGLGLSQGPPSGLGLVSGAGVTQVSNGHLRSNGGPNGNIGAGMAQPGIAIQNGHGASLQSMGSDLGNTGLGIGLGNNGLGNNGLGNGIGNGLTASQLQAALRDPRVADFLRQQLDAKTRHLNSPQTLEEKLLLTRPLQPNSLTPVPPPAVRQPPPPPPRGMRLPPPLQTLTQPSPPPPRANGIAPAKKPAATPSVPRTSGRDRASFLGAEPKADMNHLNNALEELVRALRPSEEELLRQEEAFQKVARLLKARWPHAKVHQFGSTANHLNICNNNDIDVCLEILEPEGDLNYKSQLVDEMGDLLADAGMANVLPLPKARVPVVKFAVPDIGTKVDITVNNILAIANTKLLRDYVAVDERLLKLVFIVKHWAKRRQVNDSYRGTLSSYCYVLMCIHHLQMRQPPILPCLQAVQPPTHIRTIGRWNCNYYDQGMDGFGAENQETLAELVWSFFENWAWRHEYNSAVISVRTGCLMTKAEKDWTRRIGNERHLICIEDPFEITHDLGRTVDRQTSGVLHKEFERAACLLRDLEEPLGSLFEPYRAEKLE